MSDENENNLITHQSINKQDRVESSRRIDSEVEENGHSKNTEVECEDETLQYFTESVDHQNDQNTHDQHSQCVSGKDNAESSTIDQLLDTYMNVNTQIRDFKKQINDMKTSHATQAQVDDLQANLADLTQEWSELKTYFSENTQKLKEMEARVMSARDRSLNVQKAFETIAKQAHHRDSTVQALGDNGKQFESKIDREKEMEKKLKILIKEYKHIKSSLAETMRQKERAEANLQDVKDLFRDQVVANKQRDCDIKQLKDTVTQQGYELLKLKEHTNDRQLHSDNTGLLMAERNETDFPMTERKVSPNSTGTTLSTDGMGTEITKLHKIRKTQSYHSFHHIDSPIGNPSSSLQDEFQLPPLVHSANNTTTTTTTTTVTKPKKKGQHQRLKLHSVAIPPPTQTHDNQSRRKSYPSITPFDKKD